MNRIKDILKQKGVKQVWLAEQLGKSFRIVNSYACNKRQPNLTELYRIAQVLDVDPKGLLVDINTK